ncbi:helix-turn-helix transcriptional regulator [Ellagibacter isourolithinifaciens]|uniref:helix-turn-helix transcriptional regulator n=1 Tax=Ellagibacter isourolithinifaciens TaxID=2137581 RepID=UPI003A908D01
MEQAEEIISARFSEGLTVKAIADELFVSRSRLYDAFRNVRGMGVAERMGAACSLLGSG